MMKKESVNKEILFERVYVETPVDTDGDGRYDLIAVYIRRPVSTLHGEKVPAIYVANPYMLSCNENWYAPHNVNQEVKVYPAQNIAEEDIRYDFSKEPTVRPAAMLRPLPARKRLNWKASIPFTIILTQEAMAAYSVADWALEAPKALHCRVRAKRFLLSVPS